MSDRGVVRPIGGNHRLQIKYRMLTFQAVDMKDISGTVQLPLILVPGL